LGQSVIFDTVGKLGWGVDVRTHIIGVIITRLLEDETVDWGDDASTDDARSWWWFRFKEELWWKKTDTKTLSAERRRRDVPKATTEEDCVVSNDITTFVQ